MNLVASAIRNGINFGDYFDDKEDWNNYIRGWIFGNLDALFIAGKAAESIWNTATGGWSKGISAMPVLDNYIRDIQKISKDMDGRSEVDWLDYLQAVGDVGMSGGPALSRTAGAALYITARELRRWRNWISGDEDVKRRSSRK
jgi:hypothetical protein